MVKGKRRHFGTLRGAKGNKQTTVAAGQGKERAEDFKEPVVRAFLDLQKKSLHKPTKAARDRPIILQVIDPNLIKPVHICTKFGISNDVAGIYLLVLSTAQNETEVQKSLAHMKREKERPGDQKAKPVIPVYVGYTAKLADRFRKHESIKNCLKQDTRWKGQYKLFLLVVPLDQPIAVAVESLFLIRFDFILNKEYNGCERIEDVEEFFNDEAAEMYSQKVHRKPNPRSKKFADDIMRLSKDFTNKFDLGITAYQRSYNYKS